MSKRWDLDCRLICLTLLVSDVASCIFSKSGIALPTDAIHRHLKKDTKYPVLPQPVSTENNGFVHNDLQVPLPAYTGNYKPLLENLNAFVAKQSESLCYFTWQGLPPPRGGPTLLAPHRGYWDVSDGHNDQDIEWVQAYGEAAVARLHSRVKKDGPVVGAMCSLGAQLMTRRCANGRERKKCVPAITNGTIQWPMAVSIWKLGHPDLGAAMTGWRASPADGHIPMIEWNEQTASDAPARPWRGPMAEPGEITPAGMPHAPWPRSAAAGWGTQKVAKVVRCADIPPKFIYNLSALYYCDHLPSPAAAVSSVDEAYAAWRALEGVWPPTKPCADDQAALDRILAPISPTLVGRNCSAVYPVLQEYLPGFDCDFTGSTPLFREACCSICGGKPIADVPPPPPAPALPGLRCAVCNHVYDAAKDGAGKDFADLPASWVCPVCGAPKSSYVQIAEGIWAHGHEQP